MEVKNISWKPGKQHWSGHIVWGIVQRARYFSSLKKSLDYCKPQFVLKALSFLQPRSLFVYIYIYTSVSTTIFHLNIFIQTICLQDVVSSLCSAVEYWKHQRTFLPRQHLPRQQMEQVRSKQLLGVLQKNMENAEYMPDPIASMYGMRYAVYFPTFTNKNIYQMSVNIQYHTWMLWGWKKCELNCDKIFLDSSFLGEQNAWKVPVIPFALDKFLVMFGVLPPHEVLKLWPHRIFHSNVLCRRGYFRHSEKSSSIATCRFPNQGAVKMCQGYAENNNIIIYIFIYIISSLFRTGCGWPYSDQKKLGHQRSIELKNRYVQKNQGLQIPRNLRTFSISKIWNVILEPLMQ